VSEKTDVGQMDTDVHNACINCTESWTTVWKPL